MRGTEMRDALESLRKVEQLKHFRPETAHRAIGATLALLGARRINAAVDGEPNGAGDRLVIELLAHAEDAAIRLDAIPQRSDHANDRRAAWSEILAALSTVRAYLAREQAMAQVLSA